MIIGNYPRRTMSKWAAFFSDNHLPNGKPPSMKPFNPQ